MLTSSASRRVMAMRIARSFLGHHDLLGTTIHVFHGTLPNTMNPYIAGISYAATCRKSQPTWLVIETFLELADMFLETSTGER